MICTLVRSEGLHPIKRSISKVRNNCGVYSLFSNTFSVIKAFVLHEVVKQQHVEIHLSIHGAQLSKRLNYICCRFKVVNAETVDPLTGASIALNLQSCNVIKIKYFQLLSIFQGMDAHHLIVILKCQKYQPSWKPGFLRSYFPK